MFTTSDSKPCLVQTERGFSVNYQNKLLYSKYNPAKNILSIIEKTEILPGTIILCFSPVLSYGLNELADKLAENCLMLGIEADKELYELAKNQSQNLKCTKSNAYTLLSPENLCLLPEKIYDISQSGNYKRVISVDFSGGTFFNQVFYNNLFEASRNAVSQFWKNRVTLVKFGRKYSSNILQNIKLINKSIQSIKTDKSILVLGAGESSVETLKKISNERDNYFIICVDVLLKTLKALKIKADALVCEEAQAVITKAFTGCKDNYDYLFLSLTASTSVAKINPEKNIFYTPLFSKSNFIKGLKEKNIIQNFQDPLGSVGLSAVEIASKIRRNEKVPIYISGLDFSYSTGKTHAKDSLHDFSRQKSANKIRPLENFSSSFGNDSKKIKGKNNLTVITTTILSSYADLFKYKFGKLQNLFDSGKTGLNLDIQKSEVKPNPESENIIEVSNFLPDNESEQFLQEEKKALNNLKDIFTGKIQLNEEERIKKITALLQNREYLYLHFPDGYKLELSQNFLNRIRIEIDYFLKKL